MAESLRRPIAGHLSVPKQGLLSKSWVRKYCEFFISPSGSSPQIHVFDSEEQCKEDSRDRKVLNLKNVKDIKISKNKSCCFMIVSKKEKFEFCAENNQDLHEWTMTLGQELNVATQSNGSGLVSSDDDSSEVFMTENIAYESFSANPVFSVTINDTESSKKLKLEGTYTLTVSATSLDLLHKKTNQQICQWPIKNIRRYGKTKTHLYFEAGRNCPSGAGTYQFTTDDGASIADLISKNTLKMRSSEDLHEKSARTSGNMSEALGNINSASRPVVRCSSLPHDSSVPGGFATELSNVLKHQLEEPEHQEARSSHSSAEQLNDHVNKQPPVKKDSKKEKQERKAAEQKRKLADQQAKKAAEQERKLAEQERKVAEYQRKLAGKQAKKDKGKKNKVKEKKDNEKDMARVRVESNLYDLPENAHMYEEVDTDMAQKLSATQIEPMYAEADDHIVSSAKLKATVSKLSPPAEVPLYSEPNKHKKDAWKEHGREEDNVHEEDYNLIKATAESQSVGNRQSDTYVDSQSVHQEDETYDHLGACKKPTQSSSIYGMSSAVPTNPREPEAVKNQNDHTKQANFLKKKQKSMDSAYEEPDGRATTTLSCRPTAGNRSLAARGSAAAAAYEKVTDKSASRPEPVGQEEESIYKNVSQA